jgi:deaminated glutathione amidase
VPAGGFHESPPESDADQRMFNTHVVIDSTGAQRAAYRKAHLYDADAGAAGRFRESATTRPGTCNGAVVHGTPVGVLGLTTCYDVRFPTMYAALRDAGCDVVLVPSAFMSTTGEAHWEVLLRARAIECQFYVGAAAQVGVHKGGRASYGHSMIVDPFGRVAVDAELVEDCVVSADISGSVVRSVREKMPVVSHRRLNVEGVEVFR